MTAPTLREAAQAALRIMESLTGEYSDAGVKAVVDLRAALAQQDEPVAWIKRTKAATYLRTNEAMNDTPEELDGVTRFGWEPLYAAPQPAPVAPMSAQPSDEQIDAVTDRRHAETEEDDTEDGMRLFTNSDIRYIARAVLALRPVPQPLTDEQARKLRDQWFEAKADSVSAFIDGLRAGERAHKIGGKS